MKNSIKSGKLKAEMWDKMQYMLRDYYDITVRGVFYFDGELNIKVLTKVLDKIIDKVELLKSTYHNNAIRPYWKINKDVTINDYFKVIKSCNIQRDVGDFITKSINPLGKTQWQICVIRGYGYDVLCVLVNHMCLDGGDLKELTKLIVDSYNKMTDNPSYVMEVKNESRSVDQIYKGFDEDDRKFAKKLYTNISAIKHKIKFPYSKEKGNRSRIIIRKIPREIIDALRVKAKPMGYTVNDMLLAAFVRSVYEIGGIDEKTPITIPNMVDLRRHISSGKSEGFTNLTGFLLCKMPNGIGKNYKDTLAVVHNSIGEAKKDKFIGLYSIPLIKLIFNTSPHFIGEKILRLAYSNPYIAMSNVGNILPDNLVSRDITLVDAFMTGAMEYKPYMKLNVNTLAGAVTMSVCAKMNDEDEEIIINTLDRIRAYLEDFAFQEK